MHLFKGDFITDSFNFKVDKEKCIHCGACVDVCSSQILEMDKETGEVKMIEKYDGVCGWAGCYRCERCLAACPTGAVSILGKDPEDSTKSSEKATPEALEALMRMRRSCRDFDPERTVPREEIDEMLRILENAPTGSNRQTLEFNVIYEKEEMDKLRKLVHDRAFEMAEEGIYPGWFDKDDWECQVNLEPTRNHGDMFFLNAPHLLVIHSPKGIGSWHIDPYTAMAYFDLMCEARGLGCLMASMPLGVLSKMPEVDELLGINSEERYYGCLICFGYPKRKFHRGVQREGISKTNEIKINI